MCVFMAVLFPSFSCAIGTVPVACVGACAGLVSGVCSWRRGACIGAACSAGRSCSLLSMSARPPLPLFLRSLGCVLGVGLRSPGAGVVFARSAWSACCLRSPDAVVGVGPPAGRAWPASVRPASVRPASVRPASVRPGPADTVRLRPRRACPWTCSFSAGRCSALTTTACPSVDVRSLCCPPIAIPISGVRSLLAARKTGQMGHRGRSGWGPGSRRDRVPRSAAFRSPALFAVLLCGCGLGWAAHFAQRDGVGVLVLGAGAVKAGSTIDAVLQAVEASGFSEG
jgi:hypothetical protein